MKYNICGFSQTELIKHGLDHSDALILQEIKDFYASGRMVTQDINGKEYFWVKYKMLIESLPVLGIKSRDAIYRRLMKMVACGVLEHQTVKRNGTYSYFRFGKSMPALLWSGGATSEPTGYGSNTTRGTDEKSEQKTLLTNNPSNKDTTSVASALEEEGGSEEPTSPSQAQNNSSPKPSPSPTKEHTCSAEAEQIRVHYNEVRGAMPLCRKLTPIRTRQINARLKEEGLDGLKAIIGSCKDMPHLQGQNDRGWLADLEWLTKDSNFTKVMEGKYIVRQAPTQQTVVYDKSVVPDFV
jgi:hypothetical protein